MAPVRIYRSNSSFTEEEKIWIILEYGEMASGSPKVKGQKAMMVPTGWGNCQVRD